MPIAQDMKKLTEDIEVSYGERMTWLANATKDTHQMMNEFRNDHKAMAKALDSFLDGSESTRISNFKGLLSAIRNRQRGREEEVASLLKKFDDELSEMATRLKALLSKSEERRSKSEERRVEEFKNMLTSIKNQQRAREEVVAELLDAFQKDVKEARTHWQNLAKIMASKRTGKRVPVAEVPKEAEVPKRVEEAAEEAFLGGELKAKALAAISDSPKGITLSQLGARLQTAYIRLAKPISELVNEGKVIKRDSLYYPPRSEGEE